MLFTNNNNDFISKLPSSILLNGIDKHLENFKTNNINLFTLSNYESLLEQALDTNFINQKELNILSKWNTNPSEWNDK